MTVRLTRWYPFLFAVLPILNILTRNPGGTRLDDAAIVTGASLALCAVLYLAAALLLRGRSELVPLAVLLGIFLVYGKSLLGQLSRQLSLPPPAGIAVFAGLVLLALWRLRRRRRLLDRINTFFTITGLLLVSWLGLRFAGNQIRAERSIRESALARHLAQPIRAAASAAAQPKRDIYLIVLDEYANSSVLREVLQFDNRAFEDSLRQLGFTIPKVVRSNYVHTLLSLPSLLNFSHLTSVSTEAGPRSNDATLPNYLLEHNRTVSFLRQRGYQYLFFPSQWWPSTSRSRVADWEFQAWHGFNLGRDATRSDLRRSLLSTTIFDLLNRSNHWDADYIERTMDGLESVPERTDPTFAFAHLVSPHWPYVFQADCGVAPNTVLRGRVDRQRAYTAQLQCLNRLLLRTVRNILQRSPTQPIILLQGDHGTNLLRYSSASSAEAVTPAQARERFGAFGEYYLPAGGARVLGDTVTIVNVLQAVLRHYFGAEVSPAPNDLYVSLEQTPYLFARVNPSSLGP